MSSLSALFASSTLKHPVSCLFWPAMSTMYSTSSAWHNGLPSRANRAVEQEQLAQCAESRLMKAPSPTRNILAYGAILTTKWSWVWQKRLAKSLTSLLINRLLILKMLGPSYQRLAQQLCLQMPPWQLLRQILVTQLLLSLMWILWEAPFPTVLLELAVHLLQLAATMMERRQR